MRVRVEEFVSASETDLSDPSALHELRISGKRLRYTTEVLASAFPGRDTEGLCRSLQDVQQKLGAVTDHAVACAWLTGMCESSDAATLRELVTAEYDRMETEIAEFNEWLSEHRAAGSLSFPDSLTVRLSSAIDV